MTTIYRVTVIAETTDTGGGYEGSETLFELAGGADIVGRLAPAALVDALLQTAVAAREPLTVAERVMDSAAAAGAPIETAEQTKRKRRTKQQIADDKAAEALGFRDHAHRVETESANGAQATEEGTPIGPAVVLPAPGGDVPPPYNPFAVQQ